MACRNRRPTALVVATAFAFVASTPACAKNDAAPEAFEESSKMGEIDEVPFNEAWFAPGWNDPARSSIVIAPVDTSLVRESKWWKEAKKEGKLDELAKDLQELADFTREEFQSAFREDENHRFEVVGSPRSGSVVFELAIVDVEPNKASLGALGLAATILAAPLGVAILAKEAAKGGIAMEGRIKDADSGEVIALFADREKGKFAPINVARATAFGEVQKSIREWSEQWVKVANAAPGEKVKDNKPFTLRPW
jgi:hypothetical protein